MKKIRTLLIVILTFTGFTTSFAQTSGKASYYSNSLHGRKMSNGERYDRNDFTCAHRSLPFGTKLRVINTRNGQEVVVRVTDRGPFVRGRLIDLSYAAAKQIGMIASGVGSIRIEVLGADYVDPFITTEPANIKMAEIEYGLAGVCYEFIPEWEDLGKIEEPKRIARKVSSIKTASHNKKEKKRNAEPTTLNETPHYKGAAARWTDFFSTIEEEAAHSSDK
ncbi:septal ring lytic transglycosylase RlpA family protein [Prevotella sp. HUN102]|uniref:septal ring lytic transglycosylase RlpA family protein n=1 Tax=Prevotella sp. HUN102 TaxID=1392486 RepID=UPI000490C236|nr:septal ring lytic transglycosylase RlpA family protein [Prevotella sp. HUN102]